MYINTVTVARGKFYTVLHIFTPTNVFLHPLMWVLFCSKCVKFVLSSKIEDYTWADGNALDAQSVILILLVLLSINNKLH